MSIREELKREAEPIIDLYLVDIAQTLSQLYHSPDGTIEKYPEEQHLDLAEKLGLLRIGVSVSTVPEKNYISLIMTERGRQVYAQLETEGFYSRFLDEREAALKTQGWLGNSSVRERR